MASTKIKVSMPEALQKEFKAAAKIAYPREEFAICLGRRYKDIFKVSVKFLFYPEDRKKFSTANQVMIQFPWYEEAELIAAAMGLEIIGNIHSHCYSANFIGTLEDFSTPSAADIRSMWHLSHFTQEKVPVFGICAVKKNKSRMTSLINFWTAAPPCELVA